MTARGIRYKAIKFIAMILCALMMFPAVFSLFKASSLVITNDISACSISDIGSVYYAAGGAKPVPEIKYKDTPLVLNEDFTVSYKNNKKLGTATVVIKGKGSFYGSTEKTFSIKSRPISDTQITISDVFYNPQGILPKVGVSIDDGYFREGTDYTVSYGSTDTTGMVTVRVIGLGGLTGSKEVSYNVLGIPITQAEITCDDTVTYTGDGICPAVTIKYLGVTLTENKDYTISYKNNVNAGTAFAEISALGTYSGIIAKEFLIQSADISAADFSAEGRYEPTGVILSVSGSYLGKALTEADFTYSVPDGAGKKQLIVTGTGNFCGEATVDVEIAPADISSGGGIDVAFSDDLTSYALSVKYGETELLKDTDYTVSVIESGNYDHVTVTGVGNYSGTLTRSIKKSELNALDMAVVSDIPDQTYTGEYIRPEVTLTYNGEELVYGTDYYLTYENNINAGTTVITVTGMGAYAGTVREIPFNILPLDINNCKLLCDNVTYTGSEVTPLPTITFGNYTLQNEIDFTINSYSDNIDAGKGSMTVTGKGNYCGSADISFIIVEKGYMQELVQARLDEMMEGLHDRQINSYIHSYKLGNYFNTYMTSACTCHSYCATGYESGCSCLIGRSTVLNNSGIQCAGFTMEVFEYLFSGTNAAGENTLTTYNRSENIWTEEAIKEWMILSFRPGDYMAYDNITYGYPHYIVVYSVESDGIWVYEANYGGRCKINLRKVTYTEIYNQFDGIFHRTPNNYLLTEISQ